MNEFLNLLEQVLKSYNINQNPQDFVMLFSLAFARYAAFVNTVPFLGGQSVPSRIKVAFAAALVLITFPSLTNEISSENSMQIGAVTYFFLIIKEFFVGYTLGFVASAVFEAIQSAGRIIDIQRGASMSEMLSQTVQEKVSEIGLLKLQLSISIFFAVGFHRYFISALILSFEYIPATKFVNLQTSMMTNVDFFTNLFGQIFAISIQLSLPIIISLLLTDLFFGMLNRVAPQANVFFLSMPVKMTVGIFVLILSLSFMVERYKFYFFENYKEFEIILRNLTLSN